MGQFITLSNLWGGGGGGDAGRRQSRVPEGDSSVPFSFLPRLVSFLPLLLSSSLVSFGGRKGQENGKPHCDSRAPHRFVGER